ncbi:outer membrane protein assembly factor BamA [Jeongeupia chitinilytica]|uniref:Outer membrane protein assembly factor BamA n=1 Tax=Jeongeupia chitinilytica TaxID=1041641 RepID=A0ABQ3GXT3_9NEIS|nr:outer membrane protein assembly factor BamA [Jeongeupia chitinilytica]
MTLKPLHLLLAAALGSASVAAHAVAPFVIKDIRVEGLQRTDPGTVFSYLPVKVGDRFDDSRATESIKSLFATGFFNDVRVETDGSVLIVTVEERPTIAQININGSKLLEKDQIKTALKGQNFAEGRIFDQAVLDAGVNELKQQYYSRGRYSVIIKTTITKLERNRVGVQFDISEGEVARIQQINVVGNKAFSHGDIGDLFSLTTPNWMSWYTKTDQYSKQALSADLEKLRSYYLDRGYLEFNIDSTQVAISESREDMFLTVNVSEGDKFTVSDIKLVGDTVVPREDVEKLIELKAGDVFSREKLNKTTSAISDLLGNEGYAFANVNAVPEIDKDKHTVAFTLYVDPGRKVYVRRINISGNNLTRDEVIRRELRQLESAQYDGAKVKRSKQRLNQLGYFNEVTIDTPIVPEATDQVDMNVHVTEQKTGSFNIGAGYGQSEGVVVILSLSQSNFLGSGKQFTAEINTSQSNKVYSLALTNPYATADGVSLGWNVYQRETDASDLDIGDYATSSYGAGMSMGFPVSETNRINFGLNYEHLELITNDGSPGYIKDFVAENGNQYNNYPLSMSWARDTRDSGSYPTKGWYTRVAGDISLPFSDLDYYKIQGQSQLFIPLSSEFTLMWNLEAGYGDSYGSNTYPFYKNFYVGGVNTVRGFKYGTIGPKDEDGNGIGGTRKLVSNVEFLFPMPGVKNDKSMRLSVFADAGDAWGEGEDIDFATMRYSVGAAFTWISPVGPLKLVYAVPLKSEEGDQIERFQFQLGKVF